MSDVKPQRMRPTREEVRARILAAASKVFAAKGFAGATIDAIAQTAGFTKGAVYSNFDNKDELFLSLLDLEFELRGKQIVAALGSGIGTGSAATGQKLAGTALETIRDHSDYYVLFVEYWLRAYRDPLLRERLIERRRAAAATQALDIIEAMDTGVTADQVNSLSQLVLTINLGVAMEEVLCPGTIDSDLLAHVITALIDSVPKPAD